MLRAAPRYNEAYMKAAASLIQPDEAVGNEGEGREKLGVVMVAPFTQDLTGNQE